MHRDLPPQPENRNTRRLARLVVAAIVVAMTSTLGLSGAVADELDDRRADLDRQLVAAQAAIDDASAEVNAAVAAYEAAQDELSAAEERLAAAEAATQKAKELDELRAQELATAEHELVQAEADVAAAQAAFDSVDARTNEEITVITQQSGPLVQLALLVSDVTMADLNHRVQLSETLFNASALELDELQERRFRLDAAKIVADEARATAQTAREAAAQQLADTETREKEAADARADVAAKVEARDAALAAAEQELGLEESRQAALEAESLDVDRRIAERIAKQEAERKAAEAAAKKAAEEAAARKAAAEAAARVAAARNNSAAAKPAPAPAAQKPAAAAPKPAASSSGFVRPVNGRLSSKYGMRLHPVLGYRKLHDGTDFAAACGTPIKAAAGGVVAERYYNAGYGHRLMIDHGRINGTYVTTGYNHATRYVVSVGQRVTKGQTVGYVGSTGYSTGCHLHLMVWENGSVVNPMAKWFR